MNATKTKQRHNTGKKNHTTATSMNFLTSNMNRSHLFHRVISSQKQQQSSSSFVRLYATPSSASATSQRLSAGTLTNPNIPSIIKINQPFVGENAATEELLRKKAAEKKALCMCTCSNKISKYKNNTDVSHTTKHQTCSIDATNNIFNSSFFCSCMQFTQCIHTMILKQSPTIMMINI